MPDLASLEIHPRSFTLRPGELENGGRTVHAFELDDVREVEIAERALKFLALRPGRWGEERFDESDEIGVRKRFLQKMDGAQGRCVFPMGRDVSGQHNRSRVRVAGAQVVKKFRAEVGDRFRIEDEEIGLRVDNDALGLGKGGRDVYLGRRSGFMKGGVNSFR